MTPWLAEEWAAYLAANAAAAADYLRRGAGVVQRSPAAERRLRAHAAYARGLRDPETVAGEREYQRLRVRKRAAS